MEGCVHTHFFLQQTKTFRLKFGGLNSQKHRIEIIFEGCGKPGLTVSHHRVTFGLDPFASHFSTENHLVSFFLT